MDLLKLAGAGAVTVGAVTTATAFYLMRCIPQPLPAPVNFNSQSIVQDDGSRISGLCKDGKLVEFLFEDVRTLYEGFVSGSHASQNGRCLGWKPSPSEPFTWITYNEVLERAKNVGAGLLALGLLPQNSTHVGVYSQNRPEYVIADLALWSFSMVGVPLYDTLGPEACNHIINQADISVVICDINLKVKNLLSRHKETPSLKTIVVMEEVSKENQDTAKELNVEIIQYSKLEEKGSKQENIRLNPAKPDDICIICYTSGTTGIPKGAMLTHRGYVATAAACTQQLRAGGLNLTSKDVMISYLPLAHSYERLLHAVVFQIGGQVGFFQGDVRKLMDDIKELQPTVFPCVPRLLNRFYDKVLMGVNASAMKRWLFSIALNRKERELKRYIIRNNSLWDKIVFKSIQTALGGKVRLMTTGSAPLSAKVLTFLRCIVGCPILEGYGQTESHAISNLQLVGDYSSGNVGVPLTCCAIKLTDIPEMNYSASENKGEICIKGHNVFCGYLKDKEKTEEAIDKDGWLHTGDVGQWLETGALKIIDRKKHIFKLAQGEYIAPEKVENVCVQSPLVAQMYIHGDSLQSCLVGVVVPDPEVLPRYVQEKLGIKETYQELCRHPEVKKMILGNLVELGRKSGLTSLEIVKDIYVYPELFSVENGLLTPTFKAKRQELCTYFKPQIDAMYTKLQ
ncbi:long-chain-fatty-acid--CoA ligase 1-like isoform X2 [Pomacea canaliculata]|nr:long-chain-fatty-acid--CoA ligase 1-like isoform X2 [Pomacea canaliculata]XP_025083669.1 long-chain-fatty-acid--CoA ligase 1-like isoform X2 [Pomacea canaliculata]